MKKFSKLSNRMRQAKRGKGKYCPCCVRGHGRSEKRFVNRARRRLSKLLTKGEE